jgi:hypothetical protein
MSPLKIHTYGERGLEFEKGAVYTSLNEGGVILTEGKAVYGDFAMVAVRGKEGGDIILDGGEKITVYCENEYDMRLRGFYVLGLDVIRPRSRGRRG